MFLNRGCKCYSQACCQAESLILYKTWLTNAELDKIKAECKEECCNPADSSASATSSAVDRWIKAPISEAATEHSEIRRLLNLADENSKSGEAATEHSEIPEAACQETKRLKKEEKKSGKGSFLNLADENSKSGEAAPEHFEIPEAACEETKRLKKEEKKSGKGAFSQTQKMLFPETNAKTTTQACDH